MLKLCFGVMPVSSSIWSIGRQHAKRNRDRTEAAAPAVGCLSQSGRDGRHDRDPDMHRVRRRHRSPGVGGVVRQGQQRLSDRCELVDRSPQHREPGCQSLQGDAAQNAADAKSGAGPVRYPPDIRRRLQGRMEQQGMTPERFRECLTALCWTQRLRGRHRRQRARGVRPLGERAEPRSRSASRSGSTSSRGNTSVSTAGESGCGRRSIYCEKPD